jgi:hypothetical protein
MKRFHVGLSCVGIAAVLALPFLAGCQKNLNEQPLNYWADPKSLKEDSYGFADGCSLASAQAIIKSGLPFPNYGTKDELAADGKTINKRITTVDVWLGGTRFVFPAELVRSGDFPVNNPNRYRGMGGTLPHFYPKDPNGAFAAEKDGMGAMVDVKFVCSMEPKFAQSWGQGPHSNEEAIERAKARYEDELKADPTYPGTITINRRDDIGMTEVLLDRTNGSKGAWEATYFPLNRELKGALGGSVSAIGCRTRNDPGPQKRYGGVGHTCGAGIGMTPNVAAIITIYVSHVDQMPAIFDQIQQVILNAKKAAE